MVICSWATISAALAVRSLIGFLNAFGLGLFAAYDPLSRDCSIETESFSRRDVLGTSGAEFW